MNDVQVAFLVADAEGHEDVTELKILKELQKTRRALRRYLNAHVIQGATGCPDTRLASR
jgi:hypothetical protein